MEIDYPCQADAGREIGCHLTERLGQVYPRDLRSEFRRQRAGRSADSAPRVEDVVSGAYLGHLREKARCRSTTTVKLFELGKVLASQIFDVHSGVAKIGEYCFHEAL